MIVLTGALFLWLTWDTGRFHPPAGVDPVFYHVAGTILGVVTVLLGLWVESARDRVPPE